MIEVQGTLCDYCKNCPYIELEAVAQLWDSKYYACANRTLCAQLWEHLQSTTTTTTGD